MGGCLKWKNQAHMGPQDPKRSTDPSGSTSRFLTNTLSSHQPSQALRKGSRGAPRGRPALMSGEETSGVPQCPLAQRPWQKSMARSLLLGFHPQVFHLVPCNHTTRRVARPQGALFQTTIFFWWWSKVGAMFLKHPTPSLVQALEYERTEVESHPRYFLATGLLKLWHLTSFKSSPRPHVFKDNYKVAQVQFKNGNFTL